MRSGPAKAGAREGPLLEVFTFTAAAGAVGAHSRHAELVRGLLSAGHRVVWLGPSAEETRSMTGIRYLPLPCRHLGRLPLVGRLVRLVCGLLRYRKIARSSDGLVVLGELELLAAQLVRGLRGVPVVLMVRNDIVRKAAVRVRHSPWWTRRLVSRVRMAWYLWLQRRCIPQADTVFVQRPGIARALAGRLVLPEDRFEVLPNDSGPSWTRERTVDRRREWGGQEERPLVGFVGNLFWEVKGLEVLLGAFERIRNRLAARLVVVGSGPDGAHLAKEARDRGLGEDVLLVGKVPNAVSLMRNFDVLLVPSLYDDCPNVVLEALRTGVPVVASDIEAHRYLLGPEVPTVPVADPDAMADAALRILTVPELRRKVQEAQSVRREVFDFDWSERVARRLGEVLSAPPRASDRSSRGSADIGRGGTRRLVAVGPAVRAGETVVSGQKMMFQLAVDLLRESGWQVRVFDISERSRSSERRVKGRASLARAGDYARILPKVWALVLFGPRETVYLTTAQSLAGFLRDAMVIWPLSWRGHRIVCHQFGGNYAGFFARQSRVVRFLIRKTLSRAQALVVEGELVKEQLAFLPAFRDRVRVVPNGLPEREIMRSAEPKSLSAGEPVHLLYLSNLIESKGYWDVLQAVEMLLDEGRDVRCLFVGEFMIATDSVRFHDAEEARKAFFSYLEARPDLARAVSYERRLSGAAKAAAFRRAHIFLLPSNYVIEGQPVSVLEAMAYGCVAITTEHRLIPVMVEGGVTGLFVPYNDPRAIAERVGGLIDDPETYRRMSACSVERFEERFSAESYIERLTQILDPDGKDRVCPEVGAAAPTSEESATTNGVPIRDEEDG